MKIQDCQMDISCQRSASEERESSVQNRGEVKWTSFSDLIEDYRKSGKPLSEAMQQSLQPVTGSVGQVPESWHSGALASSGEDKRRRVEELLQQLISKLFAMLSAQKKDCCCGDGDDAATGLPDLGQGSGAAGGAPGTAPGQPSGGESAPIGRRPLRVMVVDWQTETSLKVKEKESTTVCASGSVRTADGRCIDFNLDVAMSREFEAEYHSQESGSQVVLTDPLVLNFNGKAAELSDARFDFDLDADGKRESVAGLGKGSAFLALDRNSDGVINDGKELFGAQSGNGFADLKAYDTDGNNWIDEADAVYSQLRLWQPGEGSGEGQGGARLQNLKEAGVGALWLGSADSQFSLKDDANQLQAQVRRTGVWLAENGQAGSMQQVDLAT
ncbi:MAG TPA: hypothetical protein VFK74_07935 [Azospira sp.]|nr:hypothetical protein [Azospira sp.]